MKITRRVSWLEPPASRCCTALHTGNSLPDRSNNTRFGWRKAGCSRSSHNPESPTTDNHNTSMELDEIGANEGERPLARCKPGRGPLMHNHDTSETFIPITGRWRCAWNEGDAYAFVDVGPCDVVSFPPGAARRFINITEAEPDVEHVLMFVIAGIAPESEYTPHAYQIIERGGGGLAVSAAGE